MSADNVQRVYRIRIALFLLGVVLVVALLSTTYQTVQALIRLDVVERERDQWQRPGSVLQLLNVKNGNVVADLGCGSGYFALKLSPIVGTHGQVLAVDIRRVPVLFLWARAILRHDHNISIIHAHPDNLHLPTGAVDAVLIANTYRELTHPKAILNCIFHSLRPGGRLVVIDRGPEANQGEARDIETQHHELPLKSAAMEIRQSGFEISMKQGSFINPPGDIPWWLIVSRKP
jgi:ubiquinone/menaquinone biosynthesis C-methylase UbiE